MDDPNVLSVRQCKADAYSVIADFSGSLPYEFKFLSNK